MPGPVSIMNMDILSLILRVSHKKEHLFFFLLGGGATDYLEKEGRAALGLDLSDVEGFYSRAVGP